MTIIIIIVVVLQLFLTGKEADDGGESSV